MARTYQIPGGIGVQETSTRTYQIPGGIGVQETTTTTAIKQRRTIGVQRVGTRQAG